MQVRNTQYHHDLPFEEYLALPGVSYSTIKGFEGDPNKGMTLGTKVHNYLLEPRKYQHDDIAVVGTIAKSLRGFLGESLKVLDKELSFSSSFIHNGMVLRYKGRADLIKAGSIVVDIKVLSGYLEPAIERFGYKKQVGAYVLATGSKMGIIVAFNRRTGKVESSLVQVTNEITAWWEYQVVHRGEPDLVRVG